jgi:putative hemolysin
MKLSNRWIFFAVILAVSAGTARAVLADFKVQGKSLQLTEDKNRHLTISTSCVKGEGSYSCDAYSGLKKLVGKGWPHRKGGANPGAVLCTESAGGKVVLAQDEKGNQNSFCEFPDGSYVSSGSLRYAASVDKLP